MSGRLGVANFTQVFHRGGVIKLNASHPGLFQQNATGQIFRLRVDGSYPRNDYVGHKFFP